MASHQWPKRIDPRCTGPKPWPAAIADVPRAGRALGESSCPLVILATDTATANVGNGREIGGGGSSEGLAGEVSEDLAGGLAGCTPFFNGEQQIFVEIDSDSHVTNRCTPDGPNRTVPCWSGVAASNNLPTMTVPDVAPLLAVSYTHLTLPTTPYV